MNNIRAFMEGKLSAWASQQSPVVPVAYQNVAFNKPAGSKFVECFLLPSTTIQNEVAGKRATMLGLFQVNCWAPKGNGMQQAEAMAYSIVSAFPMLPKLAVSIEATPSIGKAILDDSGWVIVPVVIKYRYESS